MRDALEIMSVFSGARSLPVRKSIVPSGQARRYGSESTSQSSTWRSGNVLANSRSSLKHLMLCRVLAAFSVASTAEVASFRLSMSLGDRLFLSAIFVATSATTLSLTARHAS